MRKNVYIILAIIIFTGLIPCRAYMMTSTHYQINSDSINVGGVRQTSTNYQSEDSIGEIATDNSSSTSYKINAGYQAMWDYPPGLSFVIHQNNADLGELKINEASVNSTTFSASSNAVGGYAVVVKGETLKSAGGYTISALTSPANSSPGNSQFGINLVDNANPNVGANPSGGNGAAASGYGEADHFKFVDGDVIAVADTYSQETTFTISYLGNISPTDAAGSYSTTLTLIMTAKF